MLQQRARSGDSLVLLKLAAFHALACCEAIEQGDPDPGAQTVAAEFCRWLLDTAFAASPTVNPLALAEQRRLPPPPRLLTNQPATPSQEA